MTGNEANGLMASAKEVTDLERNLRLVYGEVKTAAEDGMGRTLVNSMYLPPEVRQELERQGYWFVPCAGTDDDYMMYWSKER